MPAAPSPISENENQVSCLLDCPAWLYLLREFEMLYRSGSAGGSKAIRGHRRRVRETLAAIIDANPVVLARAPTSKPVVAYFGRALDLGEQGALHALTRALGHVSAMLSWEYGYERMPKPLERKYAYCEILGPRGPVQTDRLILGFVLFAPRTTYPQHSHREIEESYVSVAGGWSENDAAVYAPGSLILNRAGDEHRITTGESEPCLLAYAWTGPVERLSAPAMKLSPKRASR